MLSFATAVELMAIAKSCVEREKSFGKIAQGDKLSLWRNLPQVEEELQWAYLACTFSEFIKFIIFLKEQAEMPPGLYP